MDPNAILDRLDAVLENERSAIRRLDGSGVDAAAAEKASLVDRLMALTPELRKALTPRLASFVEQLRRNGVLLVHARGILRDILRLRGAETASAAHVFTSAPTASAPNRLSIRG
jgi:hypothetical protein